MISKLTATTALTLVLAVSPALAQDQAQPQTQQAQAGQSSDQRLEQEAARYQGTEIHISPAGVRQIQQALNQSGYDVGNVDGQWNQTTGQAAANFMQAQGLEPVSQPTVSLLMALQLDNILSGQADQQAADDQRLTQETGLSGTPLHVSPAGVRVVKQALNQAGYDVGNVNGEWDQSTSEAARNYQQANGLEPVGVLDVSLIQSLGVADQVYAGGQGGQADQRLTQEQATATGGEAGGGAQQGEQQAAAGGGEAAAGGVGQGTPLYISSAGVRDLTQALNQAGYDAGTVDGQWGDEVRQAITNYQQAQGLEPTGTLTTSFLAAIGLNQWLPSAGGAGGQQVGASGQGQGQTITNETTGAVTGGTSGGGDLIQQPQTGGQTGAQTGTGTGTGTETESGTTVIVPVE